MNDEMMKRRRFDFVKNSGKGKNILRCAELGKAYGVRSNCRLPFLAGLSSSDCGLREFRGWCSWEL